MRSTAMMAALGLAGAACGVQADRRTEIAPDAETARADGEQVSAAPTENGEPVGEAEEELGTLQIIHCNRNERGAACERKCDAAGLWCPSRFHHPYKREAGDGELYECRGGLGLQSCWYYYASNKDKCITRTAWGRRLWPNCSYEGGVP